MGNLISAGAAAGASGGGKVVMADGSVRALSEPVSVAELMMDHPRHFVVDARDLQQHQQQQQKGRSAAPASKVAPLTADHVLGAGGVYVLLPATRGKVSADEARRALTASRSLARSRSMPGRLRRKLSSKKTQQEADNDDDVSDNRAAAAAVAEVEAERREETAARPDGFEEHRPEFLSRELSSRGWKPSLITIEERVAPKKVAHWLF
ncbi:hypothetical protein E2562_001334 [Oryza meyeriana var. granulata]|uniref:Uncharacterized protein n=1 Tax=Oryza meyeriana var. granulata TaxID=110450 RepID=A0A6G1DCJ3_9ORYZ|nr:hypothetical protein E2562_001334 [Oryza meyeriana var. granulata]